MTRSQQNKGHVWGRRGVVFTFLSLIALLVVFIQRADADQPVNSKSLYPHSGRATAVLADLTDLKALNIPVMRQHVGLDIGYALATPSEMAKLSERAHAMGKCGGYQALDASDLTVEFAKLDEQHIKETAYRERKSRVKNAPRISTFDPKIRDAAKEITETGVGEWIGWLVGFGSRYHALPDPNRHVQELANRLKELVVTAGYTTAVDLIDHNRTRQKSIRVRLEGATKPQEIVVLGGHLDSTVSFGNKAQAPGADDNASGSAALLEALRVLLKQGQPARTIEFFWYAGEEAGLLGSTEIARSYRAANKNVVGVMQLDMVLHAGSGENVIASISDFTTGWLRDLLLELNQDYLNVQIVDDRCGYACSDHASWYREGYPTVMPFESRVQQMNGSIHSTQDVVKSSSSSRHSALFSKIALIYALTLSKSP